MKKFILLASLFLTSALTYANSTDLSSQSKLEKENGQSSLVLTRYLVTLRTVCGTLHQTIYDDQFDSPECLYNEWEMMNKEDCGRTSYENPMV